MKRYDQLVRHSGNSDLFRAVEMSIAALSNNMPLHIHAEGLRGTGKTTIMRSVREMLPPIVRVKNCSYNCHPSHPHCPEHQQLSPEQIAGIGTEVVPCPFLEISHAAKIGTVVGSIDLGQLTSQHHSIATILPGTIPQAHRGIIFIDEINRLADTSPELTDVLLDAMGTKPGHIQIEETGLPTVELPVSVTVWAASNPDEEPGALMRIRKQLADRFDFGISMKKPSEYQAVYRILEQRNNKEPIKFANQINNIKSSLSHITVENYIRKLIATIYIDFNVESLRAVETMEIAASLSCLMAGRQKVDVSDIIQIVPMVLAHRIEADTITAILEYLKQINNSGLRNTQNLSSNESLTGIPQSIKANEQEEAAAWWKKLIGNVYERICFFNRLKKQIDTQRAGQGISVTSSGTTKMADPATIELMAPPKKATSIRELPVEELLNMKDHEQNER